MSRNFTFSEGEFYHIYNRGVEKKDIFLDTADKNRFIALLYICNSEKPVHLQLQGRTLNDLLGVERGNQIINIGAYCLMPNHFHLLVKEKVEGGVSKFMQKLSTGYTMYFNKRHVRSGVLFQGKFKATHASEDSYLKYLISYIHLNPIKLIDSSWKETGIADRRSAKKYLKNYTYSSYIDYLGIPRNQQKILDLEAFPTYFTSLNSFETEVDEWLSYQNDTSRSNLEVDGVDL